MKNTIKIDEDRRKDDGPEGRGERNDSNQFLNSIIKMGIEQVESFKNVSASNISC